MNFELTATVSAIVPYHQISEKFGKATLVVSYQDGDYTKHLAIDYQNANADKIDGIGEGQEVTVKGRVESREYNGKYYHNVTGWYIKATDASAPAPKAKPSAPAQKPSAPPVNLGDDDLPF